MSRGSSSGSAPGVSRSWGAGRPIFTTTSSYFYHDVVVVVVVSLQTNSKIPKKNTCWHLEEELARRRRCANRRAETENDPHPSFEGRRIVGNDPSAPSVVHVPRGHTEVCREGTTSLFLYLVLDKTSHRRSFLYLLDKISYRRRWWSCCSGASCFGNYLVLVLHS